MRNGVVGAWLVLLALLSPAARGEADISIDPRIELVNVVRLLAGTDRLTPFAVPEKAAVLHHFEPYGDHDAVVRLRRLRPHGFGHDAPIAVALHLGSDYAPRVPLPDTLAARAGSRAELEAFIAALGRFARDTGFDAYRAGRAGADAALLAAVEPLRNAIDVEALHGYFGAAPDRWRIVIATLMHPGGNGVAVRHADGTLEAVAVIGPQGIRRNEVHFGTAAGFRELTWHELAHPHVDPLVDAHAAHLETLEPLFAPMRPVMMRQSYGTWPICAAEHLVRAITCRLTAAAEGHVAGERAVETERQRGFMYVPALADALERYERTRAEHADLEDFFTELLAVFDRAAAAQPALFEPGGADPPRVVRTVPAAGAEDVPLGLELLEVEFDRDMRPDSWSWTNRSPGSFPRTAGQPRWTSPRTCVLPVHLARGRRYWVGVNTGRFDGFRSATNVPAEPYVIEFTVVTEQ